MESNLDQEIKFIKDLRENRLKTPNDFTIGMGNLIRKAREEKSITQAEFARKLNRRPATISHIENGKSEISVSTLVLFAIELGKPVSYFFPESIFKDLLVDIKSEGEHSLLNTFRYIINFGDPVLATKILELLADYYQDDHKLHVG
jgi:transcriptional regulator with XRE-family HTH domain